MYKNFGNKFIALMACMSALGGKTSAMNMNKNEVKNPQTLMAVGGGSF